MKHETKAVKEHKPKTTVLETVVEKINANTASESKYQFAEVEVPKHPGRKSSLDYPIAQLTADSKQSFLVPATAENQEKVKTSIRTFAYRNDMNVKLASEVGGVRVWRTSAKPKTEPVAA